MRLNSRSFVEVFVEGHLAMAFDQLVAGRRAEIPDQPIGGSATIEIGHSDPVALRWGRHDPRK